MFMIDYFNGRAKKLDIFDIKLVQGAAMGFALVLAKIFPEIYNLNIWWFVAYAVLCSIRPCYSFFLKS